MTPLDVEIIQTDALLWLEQAAAEQPESFDCIITDPPYWTLDKWRNIGTTTRLGGHKNKGQQRDEMWFPTIDRDDLWEAFCHMGTLLKKNSHAYIFADCEVQAIINGWVREGETPFGYVKNLIWDKQDAGMGYHWRARHEYIVMLEKGKRRLNDLGKPDVLQCKRLQGKHYPTEKPLAIVESLLLNSTKEGDRVLDPFCGSGVVAVACKAHGRSAVCLDISDAAIRW
ncbi:MAG: site-specific DNA-methyltransferase, partial [Chloroflexi bacterium]|nr:site-specific DNA-methyltransferase [Chloroflexota bacterium]